MEGGEYIRKLYQAINGLNLNPSQQFGQLPNKPGSSQYSTGSSKKKYLILIGEKNIKRG
jgi:hypothetical protein